MATPTPLPSTKTPCRNGENPKNSHHEAEDNLPPEFLLLDGCNCQIDMWVVGYHFDDATQRDLAVVQRKDCAAAGGRPFFVRIQEKAICLEVPLRFQQLSFPSLGGGEGGCGPPN